MKQETFKALLLSMTLLFSVSSLSIGLDLRKFQSPILDADASFESGYPKFVAYLDPENQRMPGVASQHRKTIRDNYRVKLVNEYRLYDKTAMDYEEKIMLEKYCTRYNRRLLQRLGL